MAREHRPTLVLEDEDGARLHVTQSRSGRTLILTISEKRFENPTQFQLRDSDASELADFLQALSGGGQRAAC